MSVPRPLSVWPGPGQNPLPGVVKRKKARAFAMCAKCTKHLKMRCSGSQGGLPVGILPVPWAHLQRGECPLLGSPAGYACCPWTMPLCGRAEPGARAWACVSSCFLPLGPDRLAGVNTHTYSLLAWRTLEPRASRALSSVSLSVPIRLLRGFLSHPHLFPAPRALLVLCPISGMPCSLP